MATTAAKREHRIKVDQLKLGTTGHTLIAKVLNSKTVLQKGCPSAATPGPVAQPNRIAECLIGDKTGCVFFTARNE